MQKDLLKTSDAQKHINETKECMTILINTLKNEVNLLQAECTKESFKRIDTLKMLLNDIENFHYGVFSLKTFIGDDEEFKQ